MAKFVQAVAGAAREFIRDREFSELGRLYGRPAGRDGGDHPAVVFPQEEVTCANRLCIGYKGLLLNGQSLRQGVARRGIRRVVAFGAGTCSQDNRQYCYQVCYK
jgi:hypothetical protein